MLDSPRLCATDLNRIDRLEDETKCLFELNQTVLFPRSRSFRTNKAFSLLKSLNARKSLPSGIFLNLVKTATHNEKAEQIKDFFEKEFFQLYAYLLSAY